VQSEVNPKLAAAIIAVLVVIVGAFLYFKTAPRAMTPDERGIHINVKQQQK
jgi:hypothetical protein